MQGFAGSEGAGADISRQNGNV